MAIWFTSDLHFGHVNIVKYTKRIDYMGLKRDPEDPAIIPEMNDRIVEIWNDQVADDDTVYVLGDVAMGRVADLNALPEIQGTIENVRRLKGRKELVMGNHDRPHPIMNGKRPEKMAVWRHVYHTVGFEVIGIQMLFPFDGITALCHHFPYTADHTDDVRYEDWRPADEGGPLVHGHVHDFFQTDGRQYNVGIDAWEGRFQTPQEIGAYFRSIGFGK